MKIGIYTRVSTEEQAVHGVSLIAQENALMEYAKKHDYKVVDVYSDEGLSATTLDRPGLQRLLEDVRQGRIDLILITKLDRLSRGVANYYKIADVLESNNCGWKTILEDYDSTTASGRLHINIMLSVAENEAAVTRERINFVFKNKLEKGEIVSGKKIIGYDIVDKHYVINEKEAEIVRYIFEEYPKYISFTNLTRAVNDTFNTNYKTHVIKGILVRPLYTGTLVSKSHGNFENFAPEIISKETFDNIQEIMKCNGKNYKTGKNNVHTLTRILKCPRGRYLTYNLTRKYDRDYTYVHCNHSCKYRKDGSCEPLKPYAEHLIERELLTLLSKQLNSEYRLHIERKKNVAVGTDYEDKIKKIKKKMSKLEDMYLEDMINKDKYTTRYKEYKDELDFYSEKVLKLKNEATFSNVDEEFIEFVNSSDFKDIYYKLDENKRHAFWANILKEVKVDKDWEYEMIFR